MDDDPLAGVRAYAASARAEADRSQGLDQQRAALEQEHIAANIALASRFAEALRAQHIATDGTLYEQRIRRAKRVARVWVLCGSSPSTPYMESFPAVAISESGDLIEARTPTAWYIVRDDNPSRHLTVGPAEYDGPNCLTDLVGRYTVHRGVTV